MPTNGPDDPQMNRRAFFRRGLREFLAPLAKSIEEKSEAIRQHFGPLAEQSQAPAPKPAFALPLLRPPGALPEAEFLDTCSKCGNCVRACPVEAIRLDPDGQIAGGAPFINASVSACVLCKDLACMFVCPTGALVPTPLAKIDMGLAEWNESTCFRSRPGATSEQQTCKACVDACPVGEVAIRVNGSRIEVFENGCTGCGSCQHRCPTNPKSIVVKPAAMR
jgi:ferredoxin-type protein NapG